MANVCLAALFFTVSLLAVYEKADAVCCPSACSMRTCEKFGNLCDDCTPASLYCGIGLCNMFGCNCDGGCRTGVGCMNCDCPKPPKFKKFSNMPYIPKKCVSKKAKQQDALASQTHLDEIFKQADQNENGRLDLQEVKKWAQSFHPLALARQASNVEAEFKTMDTNNDGFITKEEIDP